MHTRIHTHSHAHATTRTDEINNIAESRWRAIAKLTPILSMLLSMHTQSLAHARTHARSRIHTQKCGQSDEKAAARCRWRATAKRTQSQKCSRNQHDSRTGMTSNSEKDTNTQPHTGKHMRKAAAEINEVAVPRWRGITKRTQTHRHIHIDWQTDRQPHTYTYAHTHANARPKRMKVRVLQCRGMYLHFFFKELLL